MAIVAEEAGVFLLLANAVGEKVQRVGDSLPFRQNRRHIIVDRHVRILVDDITDSLEVPPLLGVKTEGREIEGARRGDHEEISKARIIADPPPGRIGEKQPVVPSCGDERVSVRVLREEKRDPSVRIDPENGGVRVTGGPVVDSNLVATLYDWIFPAIEPHTGFQRILGDAL